MSNPLSTAALHGQLDIVMCLIERGAKVGGTNDDGNTPLHVTAFLCRTDIVQLLLDKGGSVTTRNKRGETPVDVVSPAWSKPLADFYTGNG
jgi:ankyrin repeat protein